MMKFESGIPPPTPASGVAYKLRGGVVGAGGGEGGVGGGVGVRVGRVGGGGVKCLEDSLNESVKVRSARVKVAFREKHCSTPTPPLPSPVPQKGGGGGGGERSGGGDVASLK